MRKLLVAGGLGLGVGLVVCVILHFGWLGGWDNRLSDTLFLTRPVSDKIVLVAIDDKSIQAIGRWPWKRSEHAKLLDKLGSSPAAIGYDVSFPEVSDPAEDAQLTVSVKQSGKVVLPVEVLEWDRQAQQVVVKDALTPIKSLADVASLGVVNKLTDQDGVVRLTPISIVDKTGEKLTNFSVAVLNTAGIEKQPVVERGFMRINYAAHPKSYKRWSFVDVINGQVPESEFAGKIVLVGATAADLHDNQNTPVSAGTLMDGVEIHANTIQTILEDKYLQHEDRTVTMAVIVVMAVVLALVIANSRIIVGSVLTVVTLGGYGWWTFYSFDHGTVRSLIYPILAMAAAFVGTVMYKYLVENRAKQFIRRAFSYYLSEDVLKEVLKDPQKLKLGGERRQMTVLFSDIAGFTSISEKVEPETLATHLNKYLTRMTRIVFTYNGVLDKYVGDAVMAFWGAPKVISVEDQAMLACQAALAMQEQMLEVQKDWEQYGVGHFTVRIGINTGDMIVGNMGSEMRFDYSLLGDNVNLGSRLEGINKEYGTKITISETTYAPIKEKIVARLVDIVAVKGKALGVKIYELRALGRPDFAEGEFLTSFEKARIAYHEGKFKEAQRAFKVLEEKYPEDGPIKTYVARCEELAKHAPESWDGVYHAKSK